MNARELWERYCRHLCVVPSIGLTLDVSRMTFGDSFFAESAPAMARAYDAMDALEKGAIANPDEKRMVGHYWLRDPQRASSRDLGDEIRRARAAVKTFAADVHAGRIRPPQAPSFTRVLSIGIGGSALGPMFVADALGHPRTDRMAVSFIDNTDPDGIERTLAPLQG